MLRKRGLSLGYIANKINVSKSSVSLWCRDILLSKEQITALADKVKIAGLPGRLAGTNMNRQKKVDSINNFKELGFQDIKVLNARDRKMLGLALYWAEGSKKEGGFSFTNSDPAMVGIMYEWLLKDLGVKKEDIIPRIAINYVHEPRIKKVLNFWANLLELPKAQFRRPLYIKVKPRKVYENHDEYFGLIIIRIKKSTSLKYRILGLIDAVAKNVGVAQLVRAEVS